MMQQPTREKSAQLVTESCHFISASLQYVTAEISPRDRDLDAAMESPLPFLFEKLGGQMGLAYIQALNPTSTLS